MISTINTSSVSTAKAVDCSVVSNSLLGFSNLGTVLSGVTAGFAASGVELSGLGVRERDERPTQAPVAVAAGIQAYVPAAAGAGNRKQELTQHHTMWAFRGLDPWSDPT